MEFGSRVYAPPSPSPPSSRGSSPDPFTSRRRDSSSSSDSERSELVQRWSSDGDTGVQDPYAGSRHGRPPRMYERKADAPPFHSSSEVPFLLKTSSQMLQQPQAVNLAPGFDDLFGDEAESSIRPVDQGSENTRNTREHALWQDTIKTAVDNNTQTINLSGKELTSIPEEVAELDGIRILSEDHARHLLTPRSFSKSESKRKLGSGAETLGLELNLAANVIRTIPPALLTLDNLTFLSLRGNRLEFLPPQISKLEKLEVLNVANNRLQYLPAEIRTLSLKKLHVYPNDRLLPDPSLGRLHVRTFPWTAVGPVTSASSIPDLRELILRYLLSPAIPDTNLAHTLEKLSTPHTSPSRRRTIAPATNFEARFQIPVEPSDLPQSCTGVLRDFNPGFVKRASRLNASAAIHSVDGTNQHFKGVSRCMSSRHGLGHPRAGPPYIDHVDERMVWATTVCGIAVGSTSQGGVPLLWRGCERGCLDFLDDD